MTLSEEEVLVASDPLPLHEWLSSCSVPAQAVAAWAWATRSSETLQVALAPDAQILGPTLAVRTDSAERPVPVALVLEAVIAAVGQLSADAADDDLARRHLQQVTERDTFRLLGQQFDRPGDDSPLTARQSNGRHAGAVIVTLPSFRRALVIGVASGLDVDQVRQSIEETAREMDRLDASRINRLDNNPDPGRIIHRAIVYGGPFRMPLPARRGLMLIHVEELADILMEAKETDAGQEIGMDYVWQFLDEFSTMPGVERLLAVDFDDIWRHWLEHGVLNVTGMRDVVVHPNPLPDERHWIRAAAWEPIEAVLADAGFPPSWEWYFARLDDEPGLATVGFPRHVSQVVTEPPLIISADIDPALSDIGIDPAIVYGLIGGIAMTVINFPEVGSAFKLSDNTTLACHLIVESHPLTASGEDAPRVGFIGSPTPRPTIGLKIGSDWLGLVALDAAGAHGVLGEAIAKALVQAINLPKPAEEQLLAAWHAAPPVMLLETRLGSLGSVHQGRSGLPRSPASRGRARRMLAAEILARDIRPGIYRGTEARRICQEQILPSANEALRRELAEWPPTAVHEVAEHLNDAFAERERWENELAIALSAPWGPRWRSVALYAPEPAERTRPLELVLELLLARRQDGAVRPDRFDIAEAVDLADEALTIGIKLAGATSRPSHLHDLAVIVSSEGNVEVLPLPATTLPNESSGALLYPEIDLGAYLATERADRLRLRTRAERSENSDIDPARDRKPGDQPFVPLGKMGGPGSLLKLDAVLKEACGTGFDGISAILGTALSWDPGHDNVVDVGREDLRREAINWSGLPACEIDAALDRLVLDPEQLQGDELRYWEQERRRYRLANRPLIAHLPGRILLIPRRIEASQHVYLSYLLDGRLPWYAPALPAKVLDASAEFRKVQNRNLEREASDIVARVGLPYLDRIEPHQADPLGLKLAGEIDLLVADPMHDRLWVCEVKDLSFAVSPSTISQRVDSFLKENGHVTKLNKKANGLRANPSAAARLVGAPNPDRAWRVVPLMVTRRVEPAGFTAGLTVSFVAIADLASTLTHDTDPAFGHVHVT